MGSNHVGPVLRNCKEAQAVIQVLQEDYADAAVTDRGSYTRVSVPSFCFLSREKVESKLGRVFPLPRSLEAIMPSFAGNIKFREDGVSWQL